MSPRSWIPVVAAAALLFGAGARADAPAAQVLALQGEARAGSGVLAVGDSVAAGATVRTSADSRIGLLVSQIYVQLDPDSSLEIQRDASGHVKLALERGAARIVDTRANPVPAELTAAGATASVAGGDSEYYVLAEKSGRFAMFCEWTGPLHVTRDSSSVNAGPEQCVLARPHEPLYAANGHEHQIPLLPLPEAAFADPASLHFDSTDVAAGPPGLGFGEPILPIERQRDPCDVPGSGCSRGLTVVEPPPDTGGCAPGVVCGAP